MATYKTRRGESAGDAKSPQIGGAHIVSGPGTRFYRHPSSECTFGQCFDVGLGDAVVCKRCASEFSQKLSHCSNGTSAISRAVLRGAHGIRNTLKTFGLVLDVMLH